MSNVKDESETPILGEIVSLATIAYLIKVESDKGGIANVQTWIESKIIPINRKKEDLRQYVNIGGHTAIYVFLKTKYMVGNINKEHRVQLYKVVGLTKKSKEFLDEVYGSPVLESDEYKSVVKVAVHTELYARLHKEGQLIKENITAIQ